MDHPDDPTASAPRRPTRELFPLLSPSPQPGVTDPVCGMTVDPATARASTSYNGRTYYFCCPSCRQRFEADPQRYLGGGPEGMPAAAGTALDPVCGMTVDPATAAGSTV